MNKCIDCKKEVSTKTTKRCTSCHFKYLWKIGKIKPHIKGKNHYLWKGGKPKCIDCGKELGNYNKDRKRCGSCRTKNLHKLNVLNISGLNKKGNYGINTPNWKGGKSFKPYCSEFNEQLKESIRKRDRYKCQLCNKPSKQIHHIDYNKNNCSEENLITLCRKCHAKTNYFRDAWINLFKSGNYKIRKIPIIVFTAGTFDILNVGHINIFKKSKLLGDYLIVSVSTDSLVSSYKQTKPIIPYIERTQMVSAIKYVDKVIKQTKLIDIKQLKIINPNIITIGSDWKNKILPGLNWAKKHNIRIVYLPYTSQTSSSKIKQRIIKHAYEIIKAQNKRT